MREGYSCLVPNNKRKWSYVIPIWIYFVHCTKFALSSSSSRSPDSIFFKLAKIQGKLYLPTCSKIPVLPCGGILIQTETDTKTGARQKERERLVFRFAKRFFHSGLFYAFRGLGLYPDSFQNVSKIKILQKKFNICKTWPREHVVKDRHKIFMYPSKQRTW